VVRDDQTGIWANFVSLLDTIPEDSIAITVYLLGSLIILWCWYGVAKRLPAIVGSISWIIVFAVLLTPTISAGPNSGIAPAIFGLIFGVLTKDSSLVWSNLSLIAFVLGVSLFIGYFWSKFRAMNKSKQQELVEKKISPL
jgi:MFS superfamily sulfate permease-like transporter